MKKRIGELYGMPIVIGDENEVTYNEWYFEPEINNNPYGAFVLKKRLLDGTFSTPVLVPSEEPQTLSLSDNTELEETQEKNKGILD